MITKQMLVAIDELLNEKSEIDVTSLVNDLTLNDEERVENSILVKLLINNKLNLDKDTRYSYAYNGDIIEYQYVSHSYTKDIVRVKEVRFYYDEESGNYLEKDTYENSMTIERWERSTKEYSEAYNKAIEMYAQKNSKK